MSCDNESVKNTKKTLPKKIFFPISVSNPLVLTLWNSSGIKAPIHCAPFLLALGQKNSSSSTSVMHFISADWKVHTPAGRTASMQTHQRSCVEILPPLCFIASLLLPFPFRNVPKLAMHEIWAPQFYQLKKIWTLYDLSCYILVKYKDKIIFLYPI